MMHRTLTKKKAIRLIEKQKHNKKKKDFQSFSQDRLVSETADVLLDLL